jgi:hypothetical protein
LRVRAVGHRRPKQISYNQDSKQSYMPPEGMARACQQLLLTVCLLLLPGSIAHRQAVAAARALAANVVCRSTRPWLQTTREIRKVQPLF